MDKCEFQMTEQPIVEKALESRDGYHFHSSTFKLGKYKFISRDDIVTVCLQNSYTRNDIYVVEFYWPTIKIEKSKSLALRVFDDLKHMKTKFVAVRIQGTEIGSQKEVISNISTLRCLPAAEETEEVQAVEINGVDVERGVGSNFPSPMPTYSSSKVVAAPFNTPEGPHNQIISNGDPEIGKANTEKLPRTKQRNSRPKTVKANKEKLPETTQRRLTSAVWEHFDRLLVGGEQVAKCKHCSKVLTGSSNSGTTHLRNHLNACQKEQNQERSRLNFVKMIIKHRYPLDMADQEFFKNFVKDMQPMFEFESKDISSYIRSVYREEKEKLQLYFNKLASKFNLTVSLWKNNSGKTEYCCLIAHFIDDSCELKMKTLGLRTLEHINDTKAVGGIIQSLVSEWNIGNKVCSITVDNSFLDDIMVQQIKENCLSNLVSLSSTHWFINCTLLEDGFREMDDLLFNLKKSIEYVTKTKHGRLKFQEAVDQVKLQDGKSWDDLSLKLESDFGILDSALRSREIFFKLEQIDGNFKLNPSMAEWENAAALQSCLRCFDDIKGTQSLTRRFDHYWRLCNSALAVASVLDPRLKFKIVEFSYILIYGHDSKVQLNTFREVLTNVYNEYANETKNKTTSASVLDDINWLGNNSIWDSFSKFVTANEASLKSELELYLDEPLLPMDGAIFDILGWWCDKSQKFPILAKMARDFLAIPVSIFTSCSNIKATMNNPAVWEHFDRLLVGGEQVAKCKHCSKVLTGSSNSGTTHLRNHLNACQKEQNQERSRLNFVKMIIKHRYPLDMADQEFFKNFVKDMQPMFEFESKDISSYIRSVYREEKEKLQLYFNKLASKFNLTVSLWKNNSGKTEYCCLIAHFIDDSCELKMKTLGLRTLEHINDTKAVGGIIQSLVSEWNIGNKVCSITVDNSFLDDIMVQQIKENCLSNLVSLSSTHWFINCTLLEDGFREMDDLLFNLKKSIEYVTKTKHGRLKFQEAVDQVKLQDGKSWDDLSLKL
ncbi:hypothetical protein ES288_D02G011000v1 [Gossypium darwinii]|uniref:BED-type domain-containing protein n=1 Tax=Gossypium darwinii TaxID=34276 RepID=A0A5D2DC53_GOSDA|nr:hypothetical protein ES288_D02G011000v1 [Gossypium darwinii]